MSVYGIALVKDEADVIERTVRHMASQVDGLLVADNTSTDGTRDILEDLARELPLTVLDDPEIAHYQSRKLTALAHRASDMGAEWVVPFDADELHSTTNGRIADLLNGSRAWIYTATLYDHVPTTHDGDGHPFVRMVWRRAEPLPILKIAARTHRDLVIREGSHSCDYAGEYPRTINDRLTIRHFPYRSLHQFISKARNGAQGRGATDLDESVGAHLREYGRILGTEGEPGLERLWHERFLITDPASNPGLRRDPAQT